MDEKVYLPGGLFIDEKLEKEIELREMTGVEEDILSDVRTIQKKKGSKERRLKVSPSDRVSRILARCTVAIGAHAYDTNRNPTPRTEDPKLIHDLTKVWDDALAGDRGYALVQLRRMTQGDAFVLSPECPQCGTKIDRASLDLSELDITPYFNQEPEEARDELIARGEHELTLPSGRTVAWSLMTKRDEEFLSRIEDHKETLATAALLAHVKKVDGEKADAEVLRYLSSKDRTFLRHYFDTVEGGVDTTLEFTCINDDCSADFDLKLDLGDTNFFFPSEK